MPYYPKNKIQTDLFSNGELFKSSDFTSYVGPYYKLSSGEKYAGNNPTAFKYPILLIDLKDFDTPEQNGIYTQIQPSYTSENSGTLNYISNSKNSFVSRKLPIPYYPDPTEQDYSIGYFTRYFAKQVNDFNFVEINQSTFEGLAGHNSEYTWQLYNVTSFPWQITGNIEKVYNTNKNIVLLEEKNGFKGLSKFLKEDYIKFYLT